MLSMMVSISLRRNHAADFVFDAGEDHFRLFDARAGGRAGMQAHLAGIDGGKEIAADEMHQAQRADGEEQETRQHQFRGGPAPRSSSEV